VVGLIVGAGVGAGVWGALSGAGLGLLFASWRSTRAELGALGQSLSEFEAQLADLERRLQGTGATPAAGRATHEADTAPIVDSVSDQQGEDAPGRAQPQDVSSARPARQAGDDSLEDAVSVAFASRAGGSSVPAPSATRPPPQRSGPAPYQRAIAALRSIFLGGNTVVRAGLLVLLVGLTLLARYAAQNALWPVEARLAAAALVGLVLVALGFRQRTLRPGFGLSLQGGGLAALYLVTFFAFKVYVLVPASLAFGLFLGLATATALLSVLQRSEALLVIGSLGGFLAPVLASTGEGNHVALFSYYLLLNLSIAAVAWRQSWRIPGLVAFVGTYGVATTWGVLRYDAELFATTEPFVLAFLGLFTAVAVLHAWRRPPHLRGVVDGTLVFGTPFVSILLQAALVRDMELGLALSAAGFGLFYAAVAALLWRSAPREVRPLAEALIAIAVGFATMAIPFAFDEALTTSVAWALEGAGLYWIGARQSRAFPRFVGVALQSLAALAFAASNLIDHIDSSGFVAIANGRALSCLSLALAGVFIAQQAYAKRSSLRPLETTLAQGLGVWGLVWWTGGALAEIEQFVSGDNQTSAILVWIAATVFALELGAARSRWEPGRVMALAGLPAAGLLLLVAQGVVPHLLAHGGWFAWPVVFAALVFLWQRLNGLHPSWLLAFRAGSLWLLAGFAACAAAGLAGAGLSLANDWRVAAFGASLAAVLLGCRFAQEQGLSPFDRDPDQLLRVGLGPIAVACLLTALGMQFGARGDAAPIPHMPLLNPIDVTLGLLAVAVLNYWRPVEGGMSEAQRPAARRAGTLVLVALAFAGLNGLMARAAHQWTGVAFAAEALWDSVALQVAVSIVWTLVGLIGMLISSRQAWRPLWIGCAGLLAVVVAKLFTVDLEQLSTVAQIGTFLAVGALLLVVGYLSPVPPGAQLDEPFEGNPVPLGDAS